MRGCRAVYGLTESVRAWRACHALGFVWYTVLKSATLTPSFRNGRLFEYMYVRWTRQFGRPGSGVQGHTVLVSARLCGCLHT